MARGSRAPISFEAATAVARARGAIDDRLVHRVPVNAIVPSPCNPRQRLDSIHELADSLRAHGLLQPVVIRRRGAGYKLVAGHRRLEAAKQVGWTEITAVVRDETDDQAYILTLVENLQREDLTPKEEAAALEVLVRERNWTTRQVGEAIKRTHSYVSKRLRVFEDALLAAPVLQGALPVSTAEELLKVSDHTARSTLLQQALTEKWGQNQARKAVQSWFVTNQTGGPVAKEKAGRVEQVVRTADTLAALLDATPISDLPPAARSVLRGLYQRLSLLPSN